jgi:Restriction endonuclease
MLRRDRSTAGVRALYAGLRTVLRVRAIVRGLRQTRPWTVAMVVVLGLLPFVHNWAMFTLLAILLAVNLGTWMFEGWRFERAQIDDLDEMTGWEFECWLVRFFERLGFEVERTRYRGDYGADLITTWRGVRTAVQAKRSAHLVGIRAVQEAVAAKTFYNCERAMVVTNNYFTLTAANLARSNGVLLRTRDDLARELAALGGVQALNASVAVITETE